MPEWWEPPADPFADDIADLCDPVASQVLLDACANESPDDTGLTAPCFMEVLQAISSGRFGAIFAEFCAPCGTPTSPASVCQDCEDAFIGFASKCPTWSGPKEEPKPEPVVVVEIKYEAAMQFEGVVVPEDEEEKEFMLAVLSKAIAESMKSSDDDDDVEVTIISINGVPMNGRRLTAADVVFEAAISVVLSQEEASSFDSSAAAETFAEDSSNNLKAVVESSDGFASKLVEAQTAVIAEAEEKGEEIPAAVVEAVETSLAEVTADATSLEVDESTVSAEQSTILPTDAPTAEPTDAPTDEPTDAPTDEPTDEPTVAPGDDDTGVDNTLGGGASTASTGFAVSAVAVAVALAL